MHKDAQTNLFPLILGSLLVAVALPAVAAPPPTPAAAPVAPTVPAAAQSAVRTALPAGQVWQCIVNGQKVFSDTACGAGATIRQLSDVNGMDPTPVARAGYAPVPRYAPNPGYAVAPGYTGAPLDQDGNSADDIYSANQVAIIDGRRRHEHVTAPRPQTHAAARGRH
jgi:hypothetical protein